MRAIKFKEFDKYTVKLPRGFYLIDGNPFEIEEYGGGNIQVTDVYNIKPITRTRTIEYYIHLDIDVEEKLSVLEFNSTIGELNSKRIGDDEWVSLDDEFKYRKFCSYWTPVYKEIEVIGDPYSIEVVETVIDTGCPYIKSDYINGGSGPLLFTYSRKSAVINIVRDKFKSLGMEYKEGISYGDTKLKKIWGNSTHSTIRYVCAFNTYIFGDVWDIKYDPKGTLETLLASYNKDKETLEEIIQLKYNEYFGAIDDSKFNFTELLLLLKNTKYSLGRVSPKNSTYVDYTRASIELNNAIKLIESSYEVKETNE